MDWTIALAIGACVAGALGLFYGFVKHRDLNALRKTKPTVLQPVVDTSSITKELASVPNKVLQALKSSTSNIRGAMAEHISFLKLSSDYDRLIPIGNVVDFIGIKFDSKKDSFDGHIDFIDIKTGKSRLTQDQMKVKRLADGGRTRFVKIKINTDATAAGEQSDAD